MSFKENVYKVVGKIPKGKVATYGQIARVIGNPKASRAVGNALHINPHPGEITPCHRVVNCLGKLSCNFGFGGIENQKELLQKEGVMIDTSFCVDLNIYNCKDEDLLN